jgi:beta-lactam-binding protein with PASTA domain
LRDDGVMPDLRGLSAREANRRVTELGMTGQLTGDGFVLDQSPAAGSVAVPGTACVLTLGRQPPQRTGAQQ